MPYLTQEEIDSGRFDSYLKNDYPKLYPDEHKIAWDFDPKYRQTFGETPEEQDQYAPKTPEQQLKASGIAPERNILGDIGSNLARGVSDAVKMGGYALKSLDPDGGMEVLDPIGQSLVNASEKANTWDFMKPDESEAAGEGFIKRGIMGGFRAAPLSVAAAATGFLAGPAIGLGAVTGAAVSTLGLFGLGTYGQKYQEFKDQGIEDEQAQKSAIYSGIVEGGFEALASYAGMKIFGVDKLISQPMKSTVRELLSTPMSTWAKRWSADTFLSEIPTEMLQEALGAEIETDLGLQDEGAWKQAALEAIIPAMTMSVLFGAGAAGMSTVQKRQLKADLNNLEDQKARVKAVEAIEKGIKENETQDGSGEITKNAESWANMALDKVYAGEEISLNEDFVEYASQDEATLTALRDGAIEDQNTEYTAYLNKKLANLQAHKKPTDRVKENIVKVQSEIEAWDAEIAKRQKAAKAKNAPKPSAAEDELAKTYAEEQKQVERLESLIESYKGPEQDQEARKKTQKIIEGFFREETPYTSFNEGLADLEANIAEFKKERAREASVKALEKRQAEMSMTDRGPFQRGLEDSPDQTAMPPVEDMPGFKEQGQNLPFAGLQGQIDNSGIPVEVIDEQSPDDAEFESEATNNQRKFQQALNEGRGGNQDVPGANIDGRMKDDDSGDTGPSSKGKVKSGSSGGGDRDNKFEGAKLPNTKPLPGKVDDGTREPANIEQEKAQQATTEQATTEQGADVAEAKGKAKTPIRYNPSTNKYDGDLKNGDVVTDGEKRYIVSRASGFTLQLDEITDGGPKIAPSRSVDPYSPEFTGDLYKINNTPTASEISAPMGVTQNIPVQEQPTPKPTVTQENVTELEPWEMSRDEWLDVTEKRTKIKKDSLESVGLNTEKTPVSKKWLNMHEGAVKKAIQQGKIKSHPDYPELSKSKEDLNPNKKPVTQESRTTETELQPGQPVSWKTKKGGKIDSIESYESIEKDIYKGNITPEQLKSGFESLVKNKEQIIAELSKLPKSSTKKGVKTLLSMLGGMNAYRYKSEKKSAAVKAVYQDMLSTFNMSGGLSYNPFEKDAHINALRKKIESTTQEDIDKYVAKVKKNTEEYIAERKKIIDGVTDPQTLEDFKNFFEYAKDKTLTPEQQERYDTLKSDSLNEKQKADLEKKATITAVKADTKFEIIEGVHTKKGHDIFTVKMADRVDKDVFKELSRKAKQIGGYYSMYRGNGAIPGFVFTEREQAEKFVSLQDGDVSIKEEIKQKTTGREKLNIARLKGMAKKAEAKGQEKLNQDRNTNTSRRARMAASAEADARGLISFARTLREIAEGIESGRIKYLSGLKNQTQLDTLFSILNQARWEGIRGEDTEGMSYTEKEDQQKRGVLASDITHAKLPKLKTFSEHLRSFVEKLKEIKGGKLVASQIDKRISNVKEYDFNRYGDEEIIRKAVKKAKTANIDIPWHIEKQIADRDRLARMGIESDEQLRSALRELHNLEVETEKEDPIKAKERELVGTKPGIDFFPTPKTIANDLVDRADIQSGDKVLEPSAGKGDIADAIKENHPEANLETVELSSTLREFLELKGHKVVEHDFLEHSGEYDKIIMNPPFSKGMDVDHVKHAYSLLKPGGKIVAIMGEHPFFASDKKSVEFREWLSDKGFDEKLPEKSFTGKEAFRQTGVNSRIVEIEKPNIERQTEQATITTDITAKSGQPFKSQGSATLGIMAAKAKDTHDAVEVDGGWVGRKREVPVIEPSEYDQKREDRADRYRDRASRAREKSDQHYKQSKAISDMIPFGQPILVGHHSEGRARRDADKIWNRMGKSVEESNKAAYYEGKADTAENNTAISSDDSNATIKLKEKLRTAEQKQEIMKAVNKIVKSKKLSDTEKTKKIVDDTGWKEATAKKILEPDFAGRVGFASYELTNNNANIKRMRNRIKLLEVHSKDETTEIEFDGGTITDNVEDNRVQIFHDEKPSDEIRKKLKSSGFRWARSVGAWQRQRGVHALYLAKSIVGIDPKLPTQNTKITGEDGRAYILEDLAQAIYKAGISLKEFTGKIADKLGNAYHKVKDAVIKLYHAMNAHLNTVTLGSEVGAIAIGEDASIEDDIELTSPGIKKQTDDSKPTSKTLPPKTADLSRAEETATQKQILSGLKKVWTARKDHGKNHDKDISVADTTLGLMSHFAEKVPGLEMTFEEILKRPEYKHIMENKLSKMNEGGEHLVGVISDFAKKDKPGYKSFSEYLVQNDINQVGNLLVEENGEWKVLSKKDENGKRKILKKGFTSRSEARDFSVDHEVSEYNGSKNAKAALKAFRVMTGNLYDHYIQGWNEILDEYSKRGLTIPEVVTESADGEVRVSIKVALAKMGDRESYYFPRQRESGDWRVVGKKAGKHDIIQYRDTEIAAKFLAGKLESQGYKTEWQKTGRLSEDVYQGIKGILQTQTAINQALSETKMGDKVRTLKDLRINAEWNGVDYVVNNGGAYKWSADVLESLGAEPYSHVGVSKNSWSPGYVFKNAPKDMADVVTSALYENRGVQKDITFEIAENLATQLADTLRARGSQSRMIARDDAVGIDVPVGYESDPIKAIAQAINSAAGGHAKRQVALNTTKAISGRHFTWDEFTEQHQDAEILEALKIEKQALSKNSPSELNRLDEIAQEIRELQKERVGVKVETEKNRQKRLEKINVLFDEKKAIEKWESTSQVASINKKITRIKTGMYTDYRAFVEKNRINPKTQKNAYSEAVGATENILRNDEAADRVLNTARGLASVWFLGGKISSAAINLTALGTSAIGAMKTYGGISIRKTPQLIAGASSSYMKLKTGKGNLSDKDKAIFEEIDSRGWLAAQLNMETVNALKSGPARKYSRAVELLMVPFKVTEEFNRAVTIMAAYKGIRQSDPKISQEDALLKAKKVSDRGHGIYGKENSPSLLRSGRGLHTLSAVYQFQTYFHNYLNTLAYSIGKGEAKSAAYMILSPVLFGGVAASLLTPILKAAVMAFGGDDPEDEIYKAAEKYFGSDTLLRYGLPGLAGVSLKGSLTPNLPDFSEPIDILGPIGGMMSNVYRGAENLSKGNVLKGIEGVTPGFVGNMSKAYRETTEGVTTRNGRPVFFGTDQIKGDFGTGIMRGLGFNPTKIAKGREIKWNETKLKARYQSRKTDIYNKYFKWRNTPFAKRKFSDRQEIMQDIREFNARIRSHGIQGIVRPITQKSIKASMRSMRPTKRERLRKI